MRAGTRLKMNSWFWHCELLVRRRRRVALIIIGAGETETGAPDSGRTADRGVREWPRAVRAACSASARAR